MGHCLIVKGHRTHKFVQSTIHGGGETKFLNLILFLVLQFFFLVNEDAILISSDIIRNRNLYTSLLNETRPTPLIIKTPHTQEGGPIPLSGNPPFFSLRRAALYGSEGVRASRGSAYYLVEELENASGIPTHINLGHQTTTRSQKSCNLSQVDIVSPPGSSSSRQ